MPLNDWELKFLKTYYFLKANVTERTSNLITTKMLSYLLLGTIYKHCLKRLPEVIYNKFKLICTAIKTFK